MSFTKLIKKLHKKGIVSKKPHPIIPFLLGIISLLLLALISLTEDKILSKYVIFLYIFTGFIFIFAILHWIVVKMLN